jgi:hypothetical protein
MMQEAPVVGWLLGIVLRTIEVCVFLAHVIIMVAIVAIERVLRMIIWFASLFLPIRLIDWLRSTARYSTMFIRCYHCSHV